MLKSAELKMQLRVYSVSPLYDAVHLIPHSRLMAGQPAVWKTSISADNTMLSVTVEQFRMIYCDAAARRHCAIVLQTTSADAPAGVAAGGPFALVAIKRRSSVAHAHLSL